MAILGMIFTPYGWGQKFTLNNPMEHLLDLFKFFPEAFEGQGNRFSPFFHGFSLKKQSELVSELLMHFYVRSFGPLETSEVTCFQQNYH